MRKQVLIAFVVGIGLALMLAGSALHPGKSSRLDLDTTSSDTLEPRAYLPVVASTFPTVELGGHIRDLALPYADRMHYAGMNWIKAQARYPELPTTIVSAAHDAGFKVQVSTYGASDMVLQPTFEADIAAWLSDLAAAGVDAIEVWNEPNLDRSWLTGYISPTLYTQLLCESYISVKAAYSDTLIISAAPAPTGWFGGCGLDGCDDQPWMEGLYAAGAANCLDYLGAHHTNGATSPSATIGHPANPLDTHHSWFFLPQTQLYFDIFQGSRQIFYTEMGYASQEGVPPFPPTFSWATGTDNTEQAAWLAEAAELSVSTGMVRYMMIWNIDFPRYGDDPADGYAIFRPDDSCPACETLHALLGAR
jgi:hypothetical protein